MIQRKPNEWSRFNQRVGKMEYIELAEYGIEPDALFGNFEPYRLNELQAVCRNWPHLHIFSKIDDTYVNRYEPNAEAYCLGKGDTDPSLELCVKFVYNRERFKAGLDELLEIPESERTCYESFLIRMVEAVLESDNPFSLDNFRKAVGRK
jgi:hypothetical protein